MRIEHDIDPAERQNYSEAAVLLPVEAAGFEVVAKEIFLPVQNLYICRPK